jgi:hypothetical protein
MAGAREVPNNPDVIPTEIHITRIIDSAVVQTIESFRLLSHMAFTTLCNDGIAQFAYNHRHLTAAIFCVDLAKPQSLTTLTAASARLDRNINVIYIYYTSTYPEKDVEDSRAKLSKLKADNPTKIQLFHVEQFQQNIGSILQNICMDLAGEPTVAFPLLESPPNSDDKIPEYIQLKSVMMINRNQTYAVACTLYSKAASFATDFMTDSSSGYARFHYYHNDYHNDDMQALLLCLDAKKTYSLEDLAAMTAGSNAPVCLLFLSDADVTYPEWLANYKAIYVQKMPNQPLAFIDEFRKLMTNILPTALTDPRALIYRDYEKGAWCFYRQDSKGAAVKSYLINKQAKGDPAVLDDCYSFELIQRLTAMPQYKGSRGQIHARFYFNDYAHNQSILRYSKTVFDFVWCTYEWAAFHRIELRNILQYTTYSTATNVHHFNNSTLKLSESVTAKINSFLQVLFNEYPRDYNPSLFLSSPSLPSMAAAFPARL